MQHERQHAAIGKLSKLKMMNEKDKIDDQFLQALIKSDGIQSPSFNFTAKIMAKIPSREVVVEESSRLIGKNLTLLIFILVGIANAALLYFLWPYLSVWIPENSFLMFMVENIQLAVRSHIMTVIQRSATVSLLLVIILGTITIIGREEILETFHRFTKRTTS